MKTHTLATIAALVCLAFSSASSAAWFVKYDGVKGSTKSTAVKKIDSFKIEQVVIENHSTLSQKPKEIVVVGVKPAGWDPKMKAKVVPKR